MIGDALKGSGRWGAPPVHLADHVAGVFQSVGLLPDPGHQGVGAVTVEPLIFSLCMRHRRRQTQANGIASTA